MSTTVAIIGGIIIGFAIARIIGGRCPLQNRGKKKEAEKKEGISGYNQKQTAEKEARKNKTLEYLQEKRKATNDEIQALLGVSDASATAYLEELEKEGKIRQIGKTGHAVYYELNG